MPLGAALAPLRNASAGRSAGGARSLFQHLVDGRPPEWRRHEALDRQAEHADRATRASMARGIASWAASGRPGTSCAQTRLEVLPTRTIYEFAGAGASCRPDVSSPRRCPTISTCSRARSRTWSGAPRPATAREHAVAVYFDAASDLVVNTPDQPVLAARYQLDGASPVAHGLSRAGGAGQARRRPAHRLGLPLPGRR